jgi:hypothetical protein
MLYPGDMGSAVARRLAEAGVDVVTCLQGRSERTRRLAAEAGVRDAPSLGDALGSCDLVVALVPQAAAADTAAEVARALPGPSRPLYLDANSIAPSTVGEIAGRLEAAGVDCVDGGFIGSAAELGGRTTLYLSGARAGDAEAVLGRALSVRVLHGDVGVASAFKLSIFGFNKGLVAHYLDMLSSADAIGQRQELLACLRLFYPGSVETAERLLPSYPRHARRRADELTEVVEWLLSIDEPAAMARATREVLAELATVEFPARDRWDAEAVVDRFCEARRAPRKLTDAGRAADHEGG